MALEPQTLVGLPSSPAGHEPCWARTSDTLLKRHEVAGQNRLKTPFCHGLWPFPAAPSEPTYPKDTTGRLGPQLPLQMTGSHRGCFPDQGTPASRPLRALTWGGLQPQWSSSATHQHWLSP